MKWILRLMSLHVLLGSLVSWGYRCYYEGLPEVLLGVASWILGPSAGACKVVWWDLDLEMGNWGSRFGGGPMGPAIFGERERLVSPQGRLP